MSAPATPSPAQVAALARLEERCQAGGWAYKTGAVARPERQVQALVASTHAEPVAPSPAQAAALAWLEELRQAGGWAYKTGAVARSEREVQAQAAPHPTLVCGGGEALHRGLTNVHHVTVQAGATLSWPRPSSHEPLVRESAPTSASD